MSAAHDLLLAKKAACELVTELDMLIVAMRFGQVVKLHELEHFYRAANFIATHVIVGEKKGDGETDRREPTRLIDTHRIYPYMADREADAIEEWEATAAEYSVRALLAMLSLILVAMCAAVVEICGGSS